MKFVALQVPEVLVGRVDRALKIEGLDIAWFRGVAQAYVVPGKPLDDVPRVIAYDGPVRA